MIAWYERQLDKLGVSIKLNMEIKPDDAVLEAADRIFVATGSVPIELPIKGITCENVVGVIDAHENGIKGDKIVVCGGGSSGCDIALELAMEGKDVTIIEMLDELAQDAMAVNKFSIMRLLAENNVTILTNSEVIEIDCDGATIKKKDGSTEKILGDTIITAFGQESNTAMPDAMRQKYNTKTTVIGDAEKVSRASSAIRSGFYAAMSVE